jgi:hypothetical protein
VLAPVLKFRKLVALQVVRNRMLAATLLTSICRSSYNQSREYCAIGYASTRHAKAFSISITPHYTVENAVCDAAWERRDCFQRFIEFTIRNCYISRYCCIVVGDLCRSVEVMPTWFIRDGFRFFRFSKPSLLQQEMKCQRACDIPKYDV